MNFKDRYFEDQFDLVAYIPPDFIIFLIMFRCVPLQSVAIFITNLPVLAITAYHAYLVYEEIDFWKDYREQASATEAINNVLVRKCYNRGDHCVCRDAAEYLKKDYIGNFHSVICSN